MIVFDKVSKTFQGRGRAVSVFEGCSLALPTDRRLVIFGQPGTGKSTLIRLLAGLDRPTSGSIQRFARISFPVGYAGGLKPFLSLRQNASYAARIYDADVAEVVDFIQHVTDLGDAFDAPVRELPAQVRAAFLFTLAYAIPFDAYLLDGHIAAGPPGFREKCMAMFEARTQSSGIILTTRNTLVARHCDMGGVITDNRIALYDDVMDAVAAFEDLTKAAGRAPARASAAALSDADERVEIGDGEEM